MEFVVSEFLVLQLPSRTLPPESQISCSCNFSFLSTLLIWTCMINDAINVYVITTSRISYCMIWFAEYLIDKKLQISISNQISLSQKWPYPVLLPDLSPLLNLSLLHYLHLQSILLVKTRNFIKLKYTFSHHSYWRLLSLSSIKILLLVLWIRNSKDTYQGYY